MAPALVQFLTGHHASPSAFANPVTAGNLIVVYIETNKNNATGITISDNKSNTYVAASPVIGYSGTPLKGGAIYYAWNCNGGSSLTASYSASDGSSVNFFDLAEFSGVLNTSNPLDTHNETAETTSDTGYTSSSPVTTTQVNDLLVGQIISNGSLGAFTGVWTQNDIID